MSFALLWYARRRALQDSAWYLNSHEEQDNASADAVPQASPDVEMAAATCSLIGSQTSLLPSKAVAREVASADVEMEEEVKEEEESMAGANTPDTRNEAIQEAASVDDPMELCNDENRVAIRAEAGHPPLEASVESRSLDGNEDRGESMMALLLGPVPEASDEDAESRSSSDSNVYSSGSTETSHSLRSGKRWRMSTSQLDYNAQSRTMNAAQGAATHEDPEETETEDEYKEMEDDDEFEEVSNEDGGEEEHKEEDANRRPSKRRRTASAKLCCSHLDCPKQAVLRGLCVAHGGIRPCLHPGCTKNAQRRGLCCAHGGVDPCSRPGCTTYAQLRGLCSAHGGKLRCLRPGCTKQARRRNLCWAHGGTRRCTHPGCSSNAYYKGLCSAHGGRGRPKAS